MQVPFSSQGPSQATPDEALAPVSEAFEPTGTPVQATRASRARKQGFKLPGGNRPLFIGLFVLVVTATAVGAWNEQHKPRASFTISDSDMMPDSLAPASPDTSLSSPAGSGTTPASPSSSAPASAPTAEPVIDSVKIAAKDVNIRSQPSRKAQVLAHPAQGSVFKLSGARRQAEGIDWVGLKLADGREAWIGSSFVAPVSSQAGVSSASSAAPASASAAEKPLSPQEEIDAAAKVVSQLLVAPGKAWPQAPDALRQLSVHALLRQIFKDRPETITPQHAPALDACMKASANDKQLEKLKVYEVAAACALGLGWR